MQKYNPDFIQKVINLYVTNPTISQRELSQKFNVPYHTVVGWLTCKNRGLTPFQRYKRNRDNVIRRSWEQANARIQKVKAKRNNLSEKYGLAQSTVYNIVAKREDSFSG